MNKMKKYFSLILILAGVFLIGNKNVYAASAYWENYFKDFEGFGSYYCENRQVPGGITSGNHRGIIDWRDHKTEKTIAWGEFGGTSDDGPYRYYGGSYYTSGAIFDNVENVTVKSSNESIITAEVRPYDFSKEKKDYEDYINKYNNWSLEEINERQPENEKYEQKPTWWEYSNDGLSGSYYETEPTTWWEAYKLDTEPTNAVVVLFKIKDLGNASITISADGKNDITFDTSLKARSFSKDVSNVLGSYLTASGEGLIEILNNLDKYKDIITTYGSGDKSYNFEYISKENDDISGIINTLKGKDITVKFKQYINGITTEYYLNGKDIKSTVNKGFTFYHNISMETSINKDKINSLVDLKDALYIDFAYHGNLPAPYTMTVNIKDYIRNQYYTKNKEKYCGSKDDYSQECHNKINDLTNEQVSKYFENKKFTLLYYNPETNKMEVINDGLTANANGELELTFDHFSSYVIVGSDDYKITNNPQTSNINMIAYLLIAVISIAGISYLTISMKKRKND